MKSNDKESLQAIDKPTLVEKRLTMTPLLWVGAALGVVLVMLAINSRFLFNTNEPKAVKSSSSLEAESELLQQGLPRPKAIVANEVTVSPSSETPQANTPEPSGQSDLMGYLKQRARQASQLDKLKALQKLKEREVALRQIQVMRDSPVLSGLGVGGAVEATSHNASAQAANENENVAYLNQVGNQSNAEEQASLMGDLRYRIAQGKVIRGVIESAVDSDLPGLIRAHVTQDVYGDQGDMILIPNGSRLIGQYRSGRMKAGQTRVYIAWTRLIEPNGVTVNLSSAGSDELGRSGMTGQVDKHVVERFGSSFLMSIISVGAATYGVSTNDQYNSRSAYREGLSNSFAKMANNELEQNLNIQNTIRIQQGTPMSILVAKDISFEQVLQDGGML